MPYAPDHRGQDGYHRPSADGAYHHYNARFRRITQREHLKPMKVILSRKGFDSTAGGWPSPILPDGRMLSLPIPEPSTDRGIPYEQLQLDGTALDATMAQLGLRAEPCAHPDPDLLHGQQSNRETGWRGQFGQADAAAVHLRNMDVAPGDLFLFWGWFAPTANTCDGIRFESRRPRSDGFHAIFGYMQVGQICIPGSGDVPDFARGHPHVKNAYGTRPNLLFIASHTVAWDDRRPGWGVFRWRPGLRLSADGPRRSDWLLPAAFHPSTGTSMTYNRRPDRWRHAGDTVAVTVASRGQEFVCSGNEQVSEWATQLVNDSDRWQ